MCVCECFRYITVRIITTYSTTMHINAMYCTCSSYNSNQCVPASDRMMVIRLCFGPLMKVTWKWLKYSSTVGGANVDAAENLSLRSIPP